jgi:hypothetical protein
VTVDVGGIMAHRRSWTDEAMFSGTVEAGCGSKVGTKVVERTVEIRGAGAERIGRAAGREARPLNS